MMRITKRPSVKGKARPLNFYKFLPRSISKISKSVNAALMAAAGMLSKADQAQVSDELSFIQKNLEQAAPGTYTSQSTEIIGILKNMRDTFKDNLKEARSAEAAAVEAHDK